MLPSSRIAVLLVLVATAGCRPEAGPANEAEPARKAAAEQPPIALPQPERPLDREGVLMAAIAARSAAAAGVDDQAAQAQLDGKRFEFRIALGCSLAPAGQAGAAASFDPEKRRVEISVSPDAGATDPAIAAAAAAAGEVEAAEGFWIADPWLLVPHCAGAAPQPAPVAATEPPARGRPKAAAKADELVAEPDPASTPSARAGGVALVQFFTPQEPRSARRNGRPYAAGQTLPEGSEAPAPGNWELVLTGRLQALGQGGKVVACHSAGAGAAPACVVSVRFDRVAIVNRASGEQLAEWGAR